MSQCSYILMSSSKGTDHRVCPGSSRSCLVSAMACLFVESGNCNGQSTNGLRNTLGISDERVLQVLV